MREGGQKLILEPVRILRFFPSFLFSRQSLTPFGDVVGHAADDRGLNSGGPQGVVVLPQSDLSRGGLHAHDAARKSAFFNLSQVVVKSVTIRGRETGAD